MRKRIPLWLRHIAYSLRGGFLVRPLAITLTLGFIGALLSWLEEVFPAISSWVPYALFPSRTDPQVAQVILEGIAGSIMTVVSIVFAILLMTLTLASMQFSPRIIVSFARDRLTQWTLGIFLGTFSYCTAALPAARFQPHPFAPVATVLGAMLLALACVAWLLFFIHHISQAISVNFIMDRIAAETETVIDEIMPHPRKALGMDLSGQIVSDEEWTSVLSPASGYIRFTDTARLLVLAMQYRIRIVVLRRVGHFIPAGVPLMRICKIDRLTPELREELLGAFDLGPSRTLQQDAEFGVLQIVDIALKAISPAVNDPSTAINGVDQLSRILIRFVSRELPEPVLYDPPGVPRVTLSWIDFNHLLDSAYEQIRQYSTGDAVVSLRLLRALEDIAVTVSDPTIRATLLDRARRVVRGCSRRLFDEELVSLQTRLHSLEQLIESGAKPDASEQQGGSPGADEPPLKAGPRNPDDGISQTAISASNDYSHSSVDSPHQPRSQ